MKHKSLHNNDNKILSMTTTPTTTVSSKKTLDSKIELNKIKMKQRINNLKIDKPKVNICSISAPVLPAITPFEAKGSISKDKLSNRTLKIENDHEDSKVLEASIDNIQYEQKQNDNLTIPPISEHDNDSDSDMYIIEETEGFQNTNTTMINTQNAGHDHNERKILEEKEMQRIKTENKNEQIQSELINEKTDTLLKVDDELFDSDFDVEKIYETDEDSKHEYSEHETINVTVKDETNREHILFVSDFDIELIYEDEILEKQKDDINSLLQMELTENVQNVLGDVLKYKICSNGTGIKEKNLMERDLRKLIINENDKTQIKYAKLAILKHYDILMATFYKYCKIGGDKDWLTIKGWDLLYNDAYIVDKKCLDKDCHNVFNIVYNKHNSNSKDILRQSEILTKKQISSRKLLLNEYNTDDPWSGIWKHENNDNEEIYKIKQIGDNKLRGWIKSNEFCDINGSLNNINKTESEIMLFWHKGPRKNKRRLCKCILNKGIPISMSVKWKSIATSSIVDGIQQDKGEYILVKMDELLTHKDKEIFKYKIGLARHEYLDAMLILAQIKYNNDKYAALDKLCECNLIPFIWDGFEKVSDSTMKSIFRPFTTELHKLFVKYNSIDSAEDADDKLLGMNEWMVFVQDIFKYGVSNKMKNYGVPSKSDIIAAFELAKQGYDLELTYKGFEKAIQQLSYKIYKNKPNAKYKMDLKYHAKLKVLLKWCVKLEKSGYQPTISSINM